MLHFIYDLGIFCDSEKKYFFLFLVTKINSNLCEKKQRVVVLIYLINKNVILLDFFDKVVMSILIYFCKINAHTNIK